VRGRDAGVRALAGDEEVVVDHDPDTDPGTDHAADPVPGPVVPQPGLGTPGRGVLPLDRPVRL